MNAHSPFHPGEQELQRRTGKREAMETFGRRVIRPYMPDQHRAFFAQLPFLVVGAVDDHGNPWASLLPGLPGFAHTPDDRHLDIALNTTNGDPVRDALQTGAPLGVLGVELHTRRRNRMNGRVSALSHSAVTIAVDQSFGNCPQYIHDRAVDFIRAPDAPATTPPEHLTGLDDAARTLIARADTFFVSSHVPATDNPETQGVDVSHRGGQPGFVRVEGDTLTIPDFPGNYHFNTLGNFLINPRAGLVFADFDTGELLHLTGHVELLDPADPAIAGFKGAERGWRFTADHGIRRPDALPFRGTGGVASPNSRLTGTWEEAAAHARLSEERNTWRSWRVEAVQDESSTIRSFRLTPADGRLLPRYEPGQFLPIRVTPEGHDKPTTRTYSLTSAPGDPFLRISVKRETAGLVSAHLHDTLKPGDLIEARAPRGGFTLDTTTNRPAVLIGAGVGITPMISMARHAVNEGLRTRRLRPLTVLHAARDVAQRAFAAEFRALSRATGGQIRYLSALSHPQAQDPDMSYDAKGRITGETLRAAMALDDYDFYLCGPGPFMQDIYDALRKLGVNDTRIHAESFGPAALTRQADTGTDAPAETAASATVTFARSGSEHLWTPDQGSLLELAESHGLTPEFSCRSGTCGSCATRVTGGEVTYPTPPGFTPDPGEALICCARPAKGTETLRLDL